jgi:hypothetical protein
MGPPCNLLRASLGQGAVIWHRINSSMGDTRFLFAPELVARLAWRLAGVLTRSLGTSQVIHDTTIRNADSHETGSKSAGVERAATGKSPL